MQSKKRSKSASVHDHAFKSAMSEIRVARDFLTHYLPEKIKNTINLDSLKLCSGSYIDAELKKSETDILYEAQSLSGGKNYLYCLFEHKSKPEKWLALQLLKYKSRIWDAYLKQNSKANKLPLIVSIVLYNGHKAYYYPTQLDELFHNKDLAREYLFSCQLVDLNNISDDVLRKHTWSGLLECFLKHARHRDAVEVLGMAIQQFYHLINEMQAQQYLEAMVYYAMVVGKYPDLEAFMSALKKHIPKKLEDKMLSAKELFLQQGLERGLEEGVKQGQAEIVEALYLRLKDKEEVAKLTGLSLERVEYLLESKSH